MGLALPLAAVYACDRGWPRQAMRGLAAAMAAVGAVGVLGVANEQAWGFTLLSIFLFGFIATPWIANYLATVTVRR